MTDNGRVPPILLYSSNTEVTAAEGQCDCACVATVPLETQAAPIVNGRYRLADSFRFYPLPQESFYIAMTDSIKPAVLNESALSIAQTFQQAKHLPKVAQKGEANQAGETINDFLQQMIGLKFLERVDAPLARPVETADTLTAWLHITDRCNLRCAYCYLPHKREDISLPTGKAAIEATFRSTLQHNQSRIKFKYAGGEPLIKFATIDALQTVAQALAQQHHISVDGVVLSNATLLTPEIAARMKQLDLRLMISLDGLGAFHDHQRQYANGHGSFNDTQRGIETALKLGITPDISVTVSGRNASGLADLVSWLLHRDLPFSLNFYRENDHSASYTDLQLEEEKIITGMLAAFKVIEDNVPRRSLLASLVDRSNLATPHLRTCGVGLSYLVFDQHGQVSKCQMHMDEPITNVQARDPLASIRADQISLQNISVEEKGECRQCQWKYWCAGGCSLVTYRATGRFDVKSPNCNIYKALYPEAVRLEGLRLLKYATDL